ncbi:condensation domain-containing protein [Streptomyces sp. NPDC051815]|uniref:condensation domain-containing protein n=1 Tax=Streptomyces sp. NPDC051815 TaxID=3365674 RepID=UPI0037B57904
MTDTMAMTVVLTPGPPTSLDLHGRLTPAALTAALALLPPCTPTLHRHTAHHHTLTLPPPPFPAGRLSDLLTGATAGDREHHTTRTPHPHTDTPPTAPGTTAPTGTAGTAAPTAPDPEDPPPLTPLQHDLLLDAMTHPGAALHIGQLHWRWNGPLDTRRLTAAWQTLHDSEAVLRTALTAPTTPGSRPHLTVHPHATAHLHRHPRGSADWHTLLLAERMREFDLRHPGAALRIALLEEPDHAHRVLLTYHQALLDDWSARLLRRTLHRAYLADGRPAGSERRPDIRDHLRWIARQETAAARAYWARTTPPADAAGLPGPPHPPHPAPDAAHPPRGHGRNRHRLTPYEAMRLRTWAASRGAAESTALHAVWALQLHRATPHAPAVAFTATVSGRGIPLPGAERLPGPLRNTVPLHTPITPTTPLAHVLATLTDQTLQASAYEWLPPTQHPPRPHPTPPAEPSSEAGRPASATGRTSPDASVNEPSAETGCPPPTTAGTDADSHAATGPGAAPANAASCEASRVTCADATPGEAPADAPQSATGRPSPDAEAEADASVNEPSSEVGRPAPTTAGTDAGPHPAAAPGTAPADEPSSEAGRPTPTTAGTDADSHPATGPGAAPANEPSAARPGPGPTDGPAKRPSPSAGRRPSVPAGAGPASRPGPRPGPHPGHSRAPGQGTRQGPGRDTLVTFEATAPPGSADDPVHAELAAEGIRIDPAEAVAAHTALLYTLTAHHDTEGGLVLTSVHDRSRITDTDAAETLAQTALLLRALPDTAGPTATVAQAVALLDAVPQPRTLAPTPATASASARTLRILRAAARTGTGTICLVPPPDAPPTCYDALAAAYPGPQALTTVAPPADARTVLAALRPALARGEPLLLGGFSGAGSLACEVAERIAAHGWHPPLVAIGGTLTTAPRGGPDPVRALARTLQTAAATTTRP